MFEEYKLYERLFIVMPLMHAENLDDNQLCVDSIETFLIGEAKKMEKEELVKAFEFNLKFGHSHMDVIKKFGRYPTRNKALGRETTPEEAEYLENAARWG